MAKGKNGRSSGQQHVFRGCREAFLGVGTNGSPGTNVATLTSSSGGTANYAAVVCPLGLSGAKLTSGLFTSGNVFHSPPLRGLFNKCVDFQWYRITRAKLVFVGSVGSTATGTLTLAGYTDPVDCGIITTSAYLSSASTKSFDISTLSSKEASVPVPVDTSWKKVSAVTTEAYNTYPFVQSDASGVSVLNTVADLSVGGISVSIVNAGSAVLIGTVYLDYDLELRGPIDSAVQN